MSAGKTVIRGKTVSLLFGSVGRLSTVLAKMCYLLTSRQIRPLLPGTSNSWLVLPNIETSGPAGVSRKQCNLVTFWLKTGPFCRILDLKVVEKWPKMTVLSVLRSV